MIFFRPQTGILRSRSQMCRLSQAKNLQRSADHAPIRLQPRSRNLPRQRSPRQNQHPSLPPRQNLKSARQRRFSQNEHLHQRRLQNQILRQNRNPVSSQVVLSFRRNLPPVSAHALVRGLWTVSPQHQATPRLRAHKSILPRNPRPNQTPKRKRNCLKKSRQRLPRQKRQPRS